MKTLDEIVSALEMAAEVASVYPPAAAPALLTQKLLAVIQAGIKAHEKATGQTLDMSTLHQVTPV
jgi:hypothetical protein